jgi:hypothetical protein
MTISPRFWRAVTLLMRLDIAGSMVMTAGLLFWPTWHA